MACCGDVPTLETLAAVELLRTHVPDLKVRVVNVVDLMTLQPQSEHPHGPERPRLRRAVHARSPDHLRVPRLSVADPSPDLPPHEPRQPARARLQGRGDDDHAVRHVRAERPRPLPPGRRRDRPRAVARLRAPRYAKQAIRDTLIEHRAVHHRAWRGRPAHHRLALGREEGRRAPAQRRRKATTSEARREPRRASRIRRRRLRSAPSLAVAKNPVSCYGAVARRHTQVAKGTVCKTVIPGFKSRCRLQPLPRAALAAS